MLEFRCFIVTGGQQYTRSSARRSIPEEKAQFKIRFRPDTFPPWNPGPIRQMWGPLFYHIGPLNTLAKSASTISWFSGVAAGQKKPACLIESCPFNHPSFRFFLFFVGAYASAWLGSAAVSVLRGLPLGLGGSLSAGGCKLGSTKARKSTPRAAASSCTVGQDGTLSPISSRESVWRVSPVRRASPYCVSPALSRS